MFCEIGVLKDYLRATASKYNVTFKELLAS